MKTIIHRSDSRGSFNHGWLQAKHSFSFGRWYDPQKVNFGALRVLNDDIIQPSTGFGLHPHDNMEIISVILDGAIKHADSMGHEQVIKENEVQVMSAGTGIFHSEHNASSSDELNLLQIWIMPNKKNIEPVYDQKYFDVTGAQNKWQVLVSGDGTAPLTIQQNAFISRSFLSAGKEIQYSVHNGSFGTYLFVIKGEIEIDKNKLYERDAIGIIDSGEFKVKATADSQLICIEIPSMN